MTCLLTAALGYQKSIILDFLFVTKTLKAKWNPLTYATWNCHNSVCRCESNIFKCCNTLLPHLPPTIRPADIKIELYWYCFLIFYCTHGRLYTLHFDRSQKLDIISIRRRQFRKNYLGKTLQHIFWLKSANFPDTPRTGKTCTHA